MAEQGRKLEVELVEGGLDLEIDQPETPGAPREAWSARRLVRAWPLALLVLVVAATYGVVALRERAAHERLLEVLADQPGFVADLSTPLRPLWTNGSGLVDLTTAVGDLGVGLTWTAEASAVVAIDLRTGVEQWRRPSAEDLSTACVGTAEVEGRTVLVCQASSYGAGSDAGTPVVLEHLDPVTGEVIARGEPHAVHAAGVLDAGLVELVVEEGVTRLQHRLVDGTVVWDTELIASEPAKGAPTWLYVEDRFTGVLAGTRVFVVDGAGHVVLEHEFDVDRVPDLGVALDEIWLGTVEIVPQGGFVVREDATNRVWVYGRDGTLRASSTGGGGAAASPDDGSLGDVVVLGGAGVKVLDLGTGEVVFEDPRWHVYRGLVLDGVLVGADGVGARAIDPRSGEELWRVDRVSDLHGTDGRAVLVTLRGEDGSYLAALDAATGQERWRVLLPENAWAYVAHAGVNVIDPGASQDGYAITRYGP